MSKARFFMYKLAGKLCTAEAVAAMRGAFAHYPSHPLTKLLYDPYAYRFCSFPFNLVFFFPPLTIPVFKFYYRKLMLCASSLFIRSYKAEKWLDQYIEEHNMDQCVLVAAGYDTFSARRKDLVDQLQVFEVDLPNVQKKKREVMVQVLADKSVTERIHYVGADLSKVSLLEALTTSDAFDQQKPAFFSMLGLSYYLQKDVFYDVLKNFSKDFAVGSVLAVDVLLTDESLAHEHLQYKRHIMDFVSALGEPMVFETNLDELKDKVAEFGLKVVESRLMNDMAGELGLQNDPSSQKCCYAFVLFENISSDVK
ncbi:MAG: SAM-dependent methyltransferase [Proteobacteria bacterium]|nr:SAM-dependent methyltransferase [Pseudomonadota bacterium]